MMPPEKKAVYVLFAKTNSAHRTKISKFVLDSGSIPSYPAIVSDFYSEIPSPAAGTERDRRDSIIRRADEVWVFGEISTELDDEVRLAKRLGKPVKYFDGAPNNIAEIQESKVRFDKKVKDH